jgi:hypothetical protein
MGRNAAAWSFAVLASYLSEECCCAGWDTSMKDVLPRICLAALRSGERQEWGMSSVSPREAEALAHLANILGGWDKAFAEAAEVER